MTTNDIRKYRLYNQKLTESSCQTPAEVVGWLGAVQSQDYFGAKWAVGQRMKTATEADLEKALSAEAHRLGVFYNTESIFQ